MDIHLDRFKIISNAQSVLPACSLLRRLTLVAISIDRSLLDLY